MQILKKGICPLCPEGDKEKFLISGLCKFHYWSSLRHETNVQYVNNRKEMLPDMQEWYIYQIENSNWICENCGQPIPAFDETARYSAQAHILPKNLFRSVATHLLNRLHLGNFYGCDCHTQYDKYGFFAQSIEEMPILSTALTRFDQFKQLIHPTELKYLTHLFTIQYNS